MWKHAVNRNDMRVGYYPESLTQRLLKLFSKARLCMKCRKSHQKSEACK